MGERRLRFALHTRDNLRLEGREWSASGTPRAVIGLIHGHGDHIGRYEGLARFLNRTGCAVLAMDLRGHGRSEGQRGDLGRYDLLLSDVTLLLDEARRRHPGLPRFLYGHSMGGGLVLNYALRREAVLGGVIASAPMLQVAFAPPPWKDLLGRLMLRLWPTMSMSSGLETDALSRDPAVVRAYRADPLIHDRVTPHFLESLRAGTWALEHAPQLGLPGLLLHGDADRITSAAASSTFARRAGEGCTLRIWPGLYHELHHEPEREDVMACMATWLEQLLAEQVNPPGP